MGGKRVWWSCLSALFLLPLAPAAGADHSLKELVSTGPLNTNAPGQSDLSAMSRDGRRILFDSQVSLTSDDPDGGRYDVYERVGGTTNLVSTGPQTGVAADSRLAGASEDGRRAIFVTTEALVSQDTDSCASSADCADLYERFNGSTSLLTPGTNRALWFEAASADASRVFFKTKQSLTPDDTDTCFDIYETVGGAIDLISTGPATPSGPDCDDVESVVVSRDGLHAFFSTTESLVAGDVDNAGSASGLGWQDVYERFAGTTSLVSTGPASPNGAYNAGIAEISDDGSRALFATTEPLVAADTDDCPNNPGPPDPPGGAGCSDLYERSGGTTALVSTLPGFDDDRISISETGVTRDGARVFFHASPVPGFQAGTYERAGGSTTLFHPGAAVYVSVYGSRAIYSTYDQVVAADTDAQQDIYARVGSSDELLSAGPSGGNGQYSSVLAGVSDDGSRVFIETAEALVSSDTDSCFQGPGLPPGCADLYERTGSATSLLSVGPSGGNGNFDVWGNRTRVSADGKRVAFLTIESLMGFEQDGGYFDVYAATVFDPYPRPGGGTPLLVPFVPAYAECTPGAQNSSHVAPLAADSCEPVQLESSLLTTSTVGRGTGYLRLDVLPGVPSTPADEADVRIEALLRDVRCASAPTPGCSAAQGDYVGPVLIDSTLRTTDRANGGSGGESGTVADTSFSFPVDCSATADASRGSDCSISTTADTLVPGFAREGKRAVISAFSFTVEDAGADASVGSSGSGCPPACGTGDETPYLRQGVFAP